MCILFIPHLNDRAAYAVRRSGAVNDRTVTIEQDVIPEFTRRCDFTATFCNS